jgi:hypothetical protein
MKRIITIAAATLAVATPALAAVITVNSGTPTAPSAGAAQPGAAAAPGALKAFFTPKPGDTMLGTMRTTDGEVAAIAGVQAATKVTVVQIKLSGADATAVNKARTDNAGETARLQAAINANAAFRAELMARMVNPATIVAASIAADGTITLYSVS